MWFFLPQYPQEQFFADYQLETNSISKLFSGNHGRRQEVISTHQ